MNNEFHSLDDPCFRAQNHGKNNQESRKTYHILADEYGRAFDLFQAAQIKAGPMAPFNERLDEIPHTSWKCGLMRAVRYDNVRAI